ncbi:MAG: Uncharacterised protein [Halieaceae bacterium]|nr:MAG: Uncharacterised protein [Halieaceae bacterium]
MTLTFSATLFLSLLSPESFFWPLHVGIALLLVCLPAPTFCRWAIISGLVIGSFHFLAYENRHIPPECFDSALNFQGTIADFPRTLSSITGEQITFVVLESLTLVDGSCDIPVSIVADSDTRHAMVVMSMDTVSQLGFKRLSISAQRPLSGE